MILLVLLCFFAYVCFYHFYWKRRGLPPGPLPLPFLGTLHYFIGQSTGEELQLGWKRKYGKMYTVFQGRNPLVQIVDYQLANEMFVRDADNYIDRGVEDDFLDVMGGHGGIFFTNGDLWRENRRFALQVLRDMGLGKNLMEERILDEFHTLSGRIDVARSKSEELSINSFIDMSVGSIINSLMFSYRYTDDKLDEYYDLQKRARTFMQVTGHPLVAIVQSCGYVSIFRQLPFFKQKFDQTVKSRQYLVDFFRQRVEEYKKQMRDDVNADAEPTDYTHAFLREMKRREEANDVSPYFNDNQLALMLFDLWIAGQETTSNGIVWSLAYLIHNQDVQAKAHQELDREIGSDRLITVADRANLHYMNALVNETLRIANLAPINIPRKVARDTTVNGYLLKKDLWVVSQISLFMYDPEIYENPRKFNPDRFIDSNGKFVKSDALLPFSHGKRSCLGESLARMELFLFISNLLNQYKFLPGKELPDLTRHIAIIVRPKDFKCRVEKRF